jgi:hypothetical protein
MFTGGDNRTVASTEDQIANEPIGVARGIHPGRVVWVHDPDATNWDGSSGHWWDDNHTNQEVVDTMLSKAIHWLAGEGSDAAAWDALFLHFNQMSERGWVGYQPGERIAIKVNLNTSKEYSWSNRTNVSPQVILALLRQLIYQVGVEQSNITVYDASRYVGDPIYNLCHSEFPEVVFVDNYGQSGRVKAQPDQSDNGLVYYSDPDVEESGTTRLPVCVVEADYVINLALLKGHGLAGVTLCAKNYFGSIWHDTTGNDGWTPSNLHQFVSATREMSTYNALVDLMGHRHLGGKTFLHLIDGLYGAVHQGAVPSKWESAPFNTDWTSSLFASQDGVALDSVAADFASAEPTLAEYVTGNFDNYLHEAALANAPPSGTSYDPENDGEPLVSLGVHEHWNNPEDKQYSKNLGTGNGIELISSRMELAVDLGAQGIHTYDGVTWDKISGGNPTQLAGCGERLVSSFPSLGLYQYDGRWKRITANDTVQNMVAVGSTLYADFGATGLYSYADSSWQRINRRDASTLATYREKLVVNFPGLGLYQYDGQWQRITANDTVQNMVGLDSTLYADFGSTGLYSYDGLSWKRINKKDPSALATYGEKLVANFPGLGLYQYDGRWQRISQNDTQEDMTGVGSTLYVDFGDLGLYNYEDGIWYRVATVNCEDMVATELPPWPLR